MLKQAMNILICDDNEDDVRDLPYILDYSYESRVRMMVFREPSDALAYMRSGAHVDVCFLDTVTQGMDGIKLTYDLREMGYLGGIIFLARTKSFGSDSFKVKAVDYLLKPIMPEKVRNALSKIKKQDAHI